MSKIGIVSCNNWINKIKEDLYLKQELQSLGIDSSIISWEDPNIDYKEFNFLILRSVWGYQDKLKDFYSWLEFLEQNQIKIYNDTSLIRNNIRKDIQFETLKRNQIPTIRTEFLDSEKLGNGISNSVIEVVKSKFSDIASFVVKPIISGSGNNTFLISPRVENARPNVIGLDDLDILLKDIVCEMNNGVMIQPFISEIDYGEISSIFIDDENTHNMRRYPSVFHEKKKEELEVNISPQIQELAKQVSAIPEFKNYLYMRVDMVEIQGKPIVMEVELAEPDLLTRYMPEDKRDEVVKTFAKRIAKRL